jgi:hypothetical protein
MARIHRRRVLQGAAAAAFAGSFGLRRASAEPTTLRLGYGNAAEEQVWLLIAQPEIGKNQGKVYKLDATRFHGSDKRAQAFEAGALDLQEGSATGELFAAAEGLPSCASVLTFISRCRIIIETQRFARTSRRLKRCSNSKSRQDFRKAGRRQVDCRFKLSAEMTDLQEAAAVLPHAKPHPLPRGQRPRAE